MSITSGFFNSINGDRKYNAEQMSSIFNGIINDGVFMNIGTAFGVLASTGVTVTVGLGRAWFDSTWMLNDALYPVSMGPSEVLLDRIDAVIIEINRSVAVRAVSIKMLKGSPASAPQRPAMTMTEYVKQYPLAYVLRKAGSTTVVQADITNMVGTSSCPYVTGILKTINIDNLVAQWENEWFNWTTKEKLAFQEWTDSLKDILSGDIATSLAEQIYRTNHVTPVTLLADGWNGSAAPFVQNVSVVGVDDRSEAMVVNALTDGASVTEQRAYTKAFGIVTSGTASLVKKGPNLITSNTNDWESGQYSPATGAKQDYPTRIRFKVLVPVQPSTPYVFTTENQTYQLSVRSLNKDGQFVSSWGPTVNDVVYITAPNERFLGVLMYNTVNDQGTTSEAMIQLIQNGTIKPYIGISGGSAIFKVYKKPLTDVVVGLKGIGAESFNQNTPILLDSNGNIITG